MGPETGLPADRYWLAFIFAPINLTRNALVAVLLSGLNPPVKIRNGDYRPRWIRFLFADLTARISEHPPRLQRQRASCA